MKIDAYILISYHNRVIWRLFPADSVVPTPQVEAKEIVVAPLASLAC
jgi:hypothetical protein